MSDIRISLTQFLTYTAKASTSAKMHYVRDIKDSPNYDPSFDYWKGLRDKIKATLKANSSLDEIVNYAASVGERKSENYLRVANKFRAFLKGKDYKYFETGHSVWNNSPDMSIIASPELGLIIDGQRYFIKNYYKKKKSDEKVTQRYINSTLTLMQLAEPNFDTSNGIFAVLNLQNGKLIEQKPLIDDDIMAFKIDAATFADIWQRSL
ncbi:hypothetical protein Lpp125_00887 [Lacticaseibacillus paracasei subsp. paracasei Lpp125]|uniref:hypothetical protein n=1 Tax=Lacticaseibacillus paracasei TaxID=1597 RepID=UPI000343E10C|nr:hypothetical protein [Lacticaseibacillus paracasei]EPD02470.1 hypothetical protein Lpp125_00887 [Lacticaseibacillus paracasei subsp. paracasei Lpp125]UWP75612.1 hypothetical protein KZR06_09015 [Lacticaseibacillus paracasei]